MCSKLALPSVVISSRTHFRRVLCRAVRKVPDASVIHLTTSRGCKIVAAWLPLNAKCRATMLFSHGNAVDLGLMLPFYRQAPATPGMHSIHSSSMPAALSVSVIRATPSFLQLHMPGPLSSAAHVNQHISRGQCRPGCPCSC